MTHEETKELIDKYHARAIELYAFHANIYISSVKNIQINENGAFVEAMIWIPKEKIIS